MSSSHDNNNGQRPNYPQTTIKTTGNKPKTLHVAHRRSPSELTTLMRKYIFF